MKRIQDKIKDLVDPQSFEQVGNYVEDPAQALAAYRFTDVTSDLLSRWLDALADLPAGTRRGRALWRARAASARVTRWRSSARWPARSACGRRSKTRTSFRARGV